MQQHRHLELMEIMRSRKIDTSPFLARAQDPEDSAPPLSSALLKRIKEENYQQKARSSYL